MLQDEGYKGKLSLQCRFEIVRPELVKVCEELRVRNGARVVLEFGVQTVVKEEGLAVGRIHNISKMIAAADMICSAGIELEVSLVRIRPCRLLVRASTFVKCGLGRTRSRR